MVAVWEMTRYPHGALYPVFIIKYPELFLFRRLNGQVQFHQVGIAVPLRAAEV